MGASKSFMGVQVGTSFGKTRSSTAFGVARPPESRPAGWLVAIWLCASLPGLSLAQGEPGYVGKTTCASCHQRESSAHTGSHHDLAMQTVTHETVLGDFDDAVFDYNGVRSTFFRRGDSYFVRTDNAEGELEDFRIAYVFGIYPLQQYLVGFPDGRYQVLGISWDTRPESAGGQRWFHIYPDEAIDHADELHWTGRHQNWNYMCAECHSTGLRKNYDPKTDRFDTVWEEIDVSCEACHGPGSAHVAWAKARNGEDDTGKPVATGLRVAFDERRGASWVIDPSSGNARRNKPRQTSIEIETCARCHSRRGQLSEDYVHGQPLMQTHRPALLTEPLYFPDGQIRDEVYVYGSFLQSKMYQAGVTCSDCHDPHSQKLHAPGNAVCLQCHQAKKYDARDHHRHDPAGDGASCAECHMPPRNYMVVDPRHDHSFRIPRPDRSVSMGTPNACTNCHADKDDAWAAARTREWYGDDPDGFQRFAPAFFAVESGDIDATRRLVQVLADPGQPAIARGTAARDLQQGFTDRALPDLARGLFDDEPLVRLGALETAGLLPLPQRWQLTQHLLDDPLLAIRVDAASGLAGVPLDELAPDDQRRLQRAIQEYIDAQQTSLERPESRMNLGNLYGAQGDFAKARDYYRQALALDPDLTPAWVNLADLMRSQGRDEEGEALLREALLRQPESGALHHSLGLLLVRKGESAAALQELQLAAELEPESSRFIYVYAVALHSAGRVDEALEVAESGLARHRNDPALQQLVAQLRGR
jgi:Flp pilus assembly protein TadD